MRTGLLLIQTGAKRHAFFPLLHSTYSTNHIEITHHIELNGNHADNPNG